MPTSVDVVITLRNAIVVTLRQRSANVVTTLESRNITECSKKPFQRLVSFASVNILFFPENVLLWRQQTLKCLNSD